MTAPKSHIKVSGVWKQAKKMHIRVSGSWKEITKAYVKVSGVWKQIHQYARFLYEGFTLNEFATRGSTHNDYENLAYIGLVYSTDSSSHTYTGFTWDGAAGDHAIGGQDNGDEEHKGIAVGMINVGPLDGDYDYDKTFVATGLQNDTRHWLRLVGGSGAVNHVTSAVTSGAGFPVTRTYSGLKNDFIVIACNIRTTSSTNFAATNMTEIYRDSTKVVYVKILTADGTFTSNITSSNHNQQWTHLWAVYRPTGVT